jgi:hypothetical protein
LRRRIEEEKTIEPPLIFRLWSAEVNARQGAAQSRNRRNEFDSDRFLRWRRTVPKDRIERRMLLFLASRGELADDLTERFAERETRA